MSDRPHVLIKPSPAGTQYAGWTPRTVAMSGFRAVHASLSHLNSDPDDLLATADEARSILEQAATAAGIEVAGPKL